MRPVWLDSAWTESHPFTNMIFLTEKPEKSIVQTLK
jgi:hypothetical protein